MVFVALTMIVRTEKIKEAHVGKIETVKFNSIARKKNAGRENKIN